MGLPRVGSVVAQLGGVRPHRVMNTLKLLICLAFLCGCATPKVVPLSASVQIASTVSPAEVAEVQRALATVKGHDVNVPIDEIIKVWPKEGEGIYASCGQTVWEFRRDSAGQLQFVRRGAKF